MQAKCCFSLRKEKKKENGSASETSGVFCWFFFVFDASTSSLLLNIHAPSFKHCQDQEKKITSH